jgi:glycosyltransferase involved in cell wall biosynthesis
MQNGKIAAAWLFQKHESPFFYATGIVARLNTPQISTVAVYLEKRGEIHNPLTEIGCCVEYLASKGSTKFFNPFLIFKLARFLKQNNVDILHCHRHKAVFYGTLAAFIAKTPVIFAHVHGLNRTRGLIRHIENRLLHRKVAKVITVSDSVRRDVLACNPHLLPENVITVKNSIEFDRFANVDISKSQARHILGLPEDGFVFGTVGRLVPTKGQSYLIEAFAKVRRSLPKAHLVFIGDGRLEADLKKQAADLNCLDAITFAGARSDIPQVLRAFDCFVFPSIAEGLPGALLEAMAASVPCIASAVGGIPEVLDDKKLGYLVPAKDAESLAAAMADCAKMPQADRDEMGTAARNTVERLYSHDIVAKKLETLYKDQLSAIL